MLRVRDSIIDSSDGASLYNVICKQEAVNSECFNTVAKTFSNITGSNNVSQDDTGDVHAPKLFEAFANPAENDYRIKKSFAETDVNGNELSEANALYVSGQYHYLEGKRLGYGGGNFEFELDIAIFNNGTNNGVVFNVGSREEDGRILHMNVRRDALDFANWGRYLEVPLSELPKPLSERSLIRFVNNDTGTHVYQDGVLIITTPDKLINGEEPSFDLFVMGNNYDRSSNSWYTADMLLYSFKWIEAGVVTHDYIASGNGTGNILYDRVGDNHLTYIEPYEDNSQWKNTDAKLVDSGWNGEDIVSWAYYDDSVSDLAYSLSMDGFSTKTNAGAGRITKDTQIEFESFALKGVTQAQGSFFKESVAAIRGTASTNIIDGNILLQERGTKLDGAVSSGSQLPDLKLTHDYDVLGQGARAFFKLSQAKLQSQKAMRFSSTRVRLPLAQTRLTKDWAQSLSATKARLQSDTVRLTKDWFMKQSAATASVNGDAVQMEYVELFYYFISLGSGRSVANVDQLITTKDQTAGLRASKALTYGGTMYVSRDIQIKLNSVTVSSETDKLEVAADRLMTVSPSSAGTFATSNMLVYERTLNASGALSKGVTDELDMYANIVVPLSQTNKISGYSVSFEINPISVIYDFE